MTTKLQEYKDTLERTLNDKSKPWTKFFEKAEAKTGVNRVYLFVGEQGFYFFFISVVRYLYLLAGRFDYFLVLLQDWWRSLVYI